MALLIAASTYLLFATWLLDVGELQVEPVGRINGLVIFNDDKLSDDIVAVLLLKLAVENVVAKLFTASASVVSAAFVCSIFCKANVPESLEDIIAIPWEFIYIL